MLLDDREIAYLKGLNNNPVFQGIIEKMVEFGKTPRYRTGVSTEIQAADWAYESGRLDERESVIGFLTLSKQKPNLEE